MNQESTNMLPLTCDLASFQPALYTSFITEAQTHGVHFSLLAELRDHPEIHPKLYHLVKEGVLNSPQSDGSFERYELFCERLLYPYYLNVADSFIIACYEDEWVGLTGIIVDTNSGIGNSCLTVVTKAHQGKGIGKAIKALSLGQAAAQGATAVITENHVGNLPMLAINRRFGFKESLIDAGESGVN